MKSTGLRDKEKYYLIPQYTMKCRMYPNKEVAGKIDQAIYAIHCFHNCTVWEIYNNHACTKEKQKTGSDSETVHFVDFNEIGSVEWKKKMMTEHPQIQNAVSSAITCKSGVIADMKRAFGKKPIEFIKPPYYSKRRQRNSYTYQECFSKVLPSENHNVFYFSLAKIGTVKIRGWNERLRFGQNQELNFLEYAAADPRKHVTVTVSKDNCGDYWICFKLQNVFRPMQCGGVGCVGVDVGIKDIAIASDGRKWENRKFKKEQEKHIKALNRRMSRRQGWANEQFRLSRKSDKTLQPSRRYQKTVLANAKLQRRIARRRDYYNHNITCDILKTNNLVAVETLNVSGMFRNRHLANALSDAAMGSILQMLNYKSGWYERVLKPIDRWTPSSKRCSCCGYILPILSLSVRAWDCPECNSHHDRDVNAAKNILYYALAG